MLLSSEHMQLHTIQPQKQVHVANMKLGFTMKVKGTSEQLLCSQGNFVSWLFTIHLEMLCRANTCCANCKNTYAGSE